MTNQGGSLEGVPENIASRLQEFSRKLDIVESTINQIDPNSINDLQSQLSPLEKAKFDWISIYAINSLFFVYLKTNGVNLKDHAIVPELTRIRQYFARINEIVQAEELKKQKSLSIDKESSARIIKRSLWMHAQQNNKSKASNVSDLVNKTLDSAVEAQSAASKHSLDDSGSQEPNKKIKFQ